VFAALAVATWLTVRRTAHRSIAPLAIALASFGAIDEITQPFFRRHADPLDWVYDCIGIGIGIAAVMSVMALVRRFARAQ
jgi:VanZ family protein